MNATKEELRAELGAASVELKRLADERDALRDALAATERERDDWKGSFMRADEKRRAHQASVRAHERHGACAESEVACLREALDAAERESAERYRLWRLWEPRAQHFEASVRELKAKVRQQGTEREHWKQWCQDREQQLAAANALLWRIVKYAKEDKARTPGTTRLARALEEADAHLSAHPAAPGLIGGPAEWAEEPAAPTDHDRAVIEAAVFWANENPSTVGAEERLCDAVEKYEHVMARRGLKP